MLKKIAMGVILFIYIILIFFSACTQLTKKQPHFQHVKKMESILNGEHDFLPYQNFVFLKKYIYAKKSENGDIVYCNKSDLNCDGYQEYTTASGVVVKKEKNKLNILTTTYFVNEKIDEGKIIDIDPENDICLLEIESQYAYKAKNINIAKQKPRIGEKVYALSAPAGIASDKIRLLFSGMWAGCDDELTKLPYCYYTIPAAPGSSGSGVFNEKGELVSLISISLNGFDEISAGPRQYHLKEILNY